MGFGWACAHRGLREELISAQAQEETPLFLVELLPLWLDPLKAAVRLADGLHQATAL